MNLDDLLKSVKPQWHKAFLQFIDTGEADDAFLKYLNEDEEGQQAVELAFNAQSKAIQGLAEEFRNPRSQATDFANLAPSISLSTDFAKAVEGVLELSPEKRYEVVRQAASSLTRSAQPGRQREVEAIAEAFRENLGDVAGKV